MCSDFSLNYSTSRRSPEVCETVEEPAAARGDKMEYRAKQYIWLRRVMEDPLLSASRWLFLVPVFLYVFVTFCFSSCIHFFPYLAGTREEESFTSKMGEIGIREPDG